MDAKEKKTFSKKRFRTKFPMARIKKIMQADEDVGKIAQATPILVSKCLEMFLQDLINKTSEETRQKHGRTMTLSHLKQCVHVHPAFDFLIPLSEKVPDISEKAERRGRPKREDSSKDGEEDMETIDTIDNEEDDSEPEEDDNMEEDDELESPVPKTKKRKAPPLLITTNTHHNGKGNHTPTTPNTTEVVAPLSQKPKLNPPGLAGAFIMTSKIADISPKTPSHSNGNFKITGITGSVPPISTSTRTVHNSINATSPLSSPTPTKININNLINSSDVSPNDNSKENLNFFPNHKVTSKSMGTTNSRPIKPTLNYDEDFDEEEVVAEG